ncbi:PEP-CTERM sorting domain-containing protein [Hahella sp. KA22]|uniref:PEP-CTERM sorting domain-containing protein n=1 Tax=Hahella sp. KA22 TaxID=1628392 RepID=UPI000FDD60B5|nr:PEP-CTERM sorting domain-containing protein [Hahella sp. KA22]AZZ95193.1 PEP-CTERM sorting domain-containing protein [Hahella sp. KA22]QAY52838.1 PEP-CTERM sorting domain-containing protein [Hahella sp. KA22]
MHKVINALFLASSAVAFVGSAQAAIVDIYTDQAAWALTTGAYEVESFDRDALTSGLSISSGWSHSTVSGGKFYDRVSDTYAPTVFTFEGGATSFGGIWDLAGPGGEGTGIKMEIELLDGSKVVEEMAPTLSGTFWGFALDQGFSSIKFLEGSFAALFETYSLDELFFTGIASKDKDAAETSEVPEPGVFALLGLGMLGLSMRRRSSQA